MKLTELTIENFTAATQSGEPVPGGGSISALCGALSAALGEMVGRLTVGKKKYADVQPIMEDAIEKLQSITPKMLEAVDLDSQAYDAVFNAYKLPKETDEEKSIRSEAIQTAMKGAATVPLTVAKTIGDILPTLLLLAQSGNQNAITDAYVATLCARTAILGASANVRINLTSIKDKTFVDQTEANVSLLIEKANDAEEKASELLKKALGM